MVYLLAFCSENSIARNPGMRKIFDVFIFPGAPGRKTGQKRPKILDNKRVRDIKYTVVFPAGRRGRGKKL
jgi:hypothetical protein